MCFLPSTLAYLPLPSCLSLPLCLYLFSVSIYPISLQVESCLRDRIMDITSEDCTKQVIRLVTEAHGDVHLDPVLLRACQKDIGYFCGRIVPGRGNIIECLQVKRHLWWELKEYIICSNFLSLYPKGIFSYFANNSPTFFKILSLIP